MEERRMTMKYDGKKHVYVNGGDLLFKVHIDSGWVDVIGKTKAHPIALVNGEIYTAGYNGFVRLKLDD